jgi:hypothetical protein
MAVQHIFKILVGADSRVAFDGRGGYNSATGRRRRRTTKVTRFTNPCGFLDIYFAKTLFGKCSRGFRQKSLRT